MEIRDFQLLWLDVAKNPRYRDLVTEDDLSFFIAKSTELGLPFLTVALPAMGKALDSAFTKPESERLLILRGINLEVDGAGGFLSQLLKSVISGSPNAVDCWRQLTLMFYKLEVPYETELVDQFLIDFQNVDSDLGPINSWLRWCAVGGYNSLPSTPNFLAAQLISSMRSTIARILCNSDPTDVVPRHGGGATANRVKNWDKYHQFRFIPKLDRVFPYAENFFFSSTHLVDELEKLSESTVEDTPKARICLVPKDSRGPRIISCEPAEFMYIQQGIMSKMYDLLETHPLTAGQINFSDQSVNQLLACIGSKYDSLATLDLKDASDRVSLELVRQIFPPNWVECFEACRSEITVLPNGRGEVRLNKFAPMGSSCCFPVEALVFWTCAQAVLGIHQLKGEVYVYGDDIICESAHARLIVEGLELIGLQVNMQKSYITGPFRESCGGDYFLGEDVTPVRVRKEISNVGMGLQHCADFLNELIRKFGYEQSLSTIRYFEDVLDYFYPRTELEIPLTLRVPTCAMNDVFFRRRFNQDLQRYEHRILRLGTPVKEFRPPDWGELLRKQLTKEMPDEQAGEDRYRNSITVMERPLGPGSYAVPSSVHKYWAYVWLG